MLECKSAGKEKATLPKTSLPVPSTSLQGLSEMGSLGISSVFIPGGTIRAGRLELWSVAGLGENVLSLKTVSYQPLFLLTSLPVFLSRSLSQHALRQRTLEKFQDAGQLNLSCFFVEVHEAAQTLTSRFIRVSTLPLVVVVRKRDDRVPGWSRPGVQLPRSNTGVRISHD